PNVAGRLMSNRRAFARRRWARGTRGMCGGVAAQVRCYVADGSSHLPMPRRVGYDACPPRMEQRAALSARPGGTRDASPTASQGDMTMHSTSASIDAQSQAQPVLPTQIANQIGIATISKPPVNSLSSDVCDQL